MQVAKEIIQMLKFILSFQASWYIQTLLYNICTDINRVGGHALSRSILQDLVDSLNEKILESYEDLLKSQKKGSSKEGQVPIGQVRALQLLFDLKLMSNVFILPSTWAANCLTWAQSPVPLC